jgi:hypothetical protein
MDSTTSGKIALLSDEFFVFKLVVVCSSRVKFALLWINGCWEFWNNNCPLSVYQIRDALVVWWGWIYSLVYQIGIIDMMSPNTLLCINKEAHNTYFVLYPVLKNSRLSVVLCWFASLHVVTVISCTYSILLVYIFKMKRILQCCLLMKMLCW